MWPNLVKIGSFEVGSYGAISFVAIILALFVFWKRAKDEYYDEMEVVDLAIMTMLWAVLLGRFGYILLNFGDFGFNLWSWLAIWEKPGFWWMGLLIGGVWSVWRTCKMKKWNLFKTFDLAVIGVALFNSLESLGHFLVGNGLGKTTTWIVGVNFPGLFEKRHPVGLYGFFLWLGVFVYLWWVEGRYRRFVWYQKSKGDARPGFLAYLYLIFFGVIGIVVGGFSESRYTFWEINIDMIMRLVVLILGLCGLFIRSGVEGEEIFETISEKINKIIRKK